jgi:transcriptional regulator with XRE-family HTH domain
MAEERRLPNYLRTYRKRCGFSQREIAMLLGAGSGSKVSHYERFLREPALRNALRCEVIFDVPVRELFAGIFDEVEKDVRRRARLLANRMRRRRDDPRLASKLAMLSLVTKRGTQEPFYEPLDPAA